MKYKGLIIFIVAVVLLGAGIYFLQKIPPKSGALDSFATCLKDKGVLFYGAFWCPHCANQKALFGRSVNKLPYIECSTPDGNGQTQICIDKKIETYPTWIFPDGTTETGELTLAHLAEKSNCQLPQ